jgi:hypothetical protein
MRIPYRSPNEIVGTTKMSTDAMASVWTPAVSFDHLVGEGEQREASWWNVTQQLATGATIRAAFGIGAATLVVVEQSQVVERVRNATLVRTESFLSYCQRPLVQRLSVCVATLPSIELRQLLSESATSGWSAGAAQFVAPAPVQITAWKLYVTNQNAISARWRRWTARNSNAAIVSLTGRAPPIVGSALVDERGLERRIAIL